MASLSLAQPAADAAPSMHHRRERIAALTFSVNPMAMVFLMMGVLALLGVFSLTYLNAQSTKGYMINKLEDDYQELMADKEINEMLILNARSMASIEQHPQLQNMLRPQHVYYMDTLVGVASSEGES